MISCASERGIRSSEPVRTNVFPAKHSAHCRSRPRGWIPRARSRSSTFFPRSLENHSKAARATTGPIFVTASESRASFLFALSAKPASKPPTDLIGLLHETLITLDEVLSLALTFAAVAFCTRICAGHFFFANHRER